MKNVKRFLAVFMAALLMLGSLELNRSIIAKADTPPTGVYRGTTLDYSVSIEGSYTGSGGGLSFEYDSTVLELVNAAWTIPDGSVIEQMDLSKKRGVFAYQSAQVFSGTMATLQFKVKDEVAFGTSSVITATIEVRKGTETTGKETLTLGTIVVICAHNYSAWAKADDENHSRTCSICGNVETEAHIAGDWETTVGATCTTAGAEEQKCTVCETVLNTRDVNPTGHDLVHHGEKAATCTEAGWNAYDTCTRCDYTTYVEITALGHNLIHHDAKAPTCTEIGWSAYDTCSRCDYSTYVPIPATGHRFSEEWQNNGEGHWHVCLNDGCTETDFYEHSCEGGVCTVCGYRIYYVGDFDGNEEVDSDDAIYLLFHAYFPDDYPISQPADFNGDGTVDSDDAIYLLFYVFFPDDYPLAN